MIYDYVHCWRVNIGNFDCTLCRNADIIITILTYPVSVSYDRGELSERWDGVCYNPIGALFCVMAANE